ncbi:MAG TPA: hypothetical protein VM778_06610 [Gemmatimonadota bacterium]|nr:hypothetical protein [Gemmatimonadota bacterium]
MRFLKLLPVFAVAMVLGLAACAQDGAEEGEELTPADTAAMDMEMEMEEPMVDEAVDDTLITEGDTIVM